MIMENTLKYITWFWDILTRPYALFKNVELSLAGLIFSAFAIFLSWNLSKIISAVLSKWLQKKNVDSGVRDSLEKFSRYLIFSISVILILDNIGISISSLAALGAVLMVGVGFGLQNLAQNFISGIILLIERPIKVGDIVNVGDISGRIIDIRVRSTIIQTRDEITIIVPNSRFISEEVINDSFSGKAILQHLKVGVSYSSNVSTVQEILTTCALNHLKVLKNPSPFALLCNFADSCLEFDLRYWSDEHWAKDKISSDIRLDILNKFNKAGIEIPYPQREILIKK